MFIFEAGPASGIYAPKPDDAVQKLSENIFKLSCNLRELVVNYNRQAIQQLESPNPNLNQPIRAGVDIGAIILPMEQIIDIAAKSLNMSKDAFQIAGAQLTLSAPAHSPLIATLDTSAPVSLPAGARIDLTEAVKKIRQEGPESITHLASVVIGLGLTEENAKQYILGALALAKGPEYETYGLVVSENGSILPAGAAQTPLAQTTQQAESLQETAQVVQAEPVQPEAMHETAQIVQRQGEVAPEARHETAQAVQAETAQEVRQQGGKSEEIVQSGQGILTDIMESCNKLKERMKTAGKNEKDMIEYALQFENDRLGQAGNMPAGPQRDAEYGDIRSSLNYYYEQIGNNAEYAEDRNWMAGTGHTLPMTVNGEQVQGSEWQTNLFPTINPEVKYGKVVVGEGRRRVELQVIVGDVKDFVIVYPDYEKGKRKPKNKDEGLVVPKRSLLTSPTDPAVFGKKLREKSVPAADKEIEDILKLKSGKSMTLTLSDGKPYRFDMRKKEIKVSEVAPLKENENWVYNPGTYFHAHKNFAVVTSGTYMTQDGDGISYPMGGLKINGVNLEATRQSVFENEKDPRYETFRSEYSPATMEWASTLYIDANGKPGIKGSLDASEEERKRWPTWIEIGKLVVSGGKSTIEKDPPKAEKEFRMAIVVINGKIGVVTATDYCLRSDFAKALENIPGIESAAQIDGSTASQTAIRTPGKPVNMTSGRGTPNLFGFSASQMFSAGKKEGKEDAQENETY